MRIGGLAGAALLLPFIATPALDAPRADRSLATVLRQLRKISPTEGYLQGAVPPEAKSGLREAKKQLRELILSHLDEIPTGTESAHLAREGIVRKLRDQRVVVGVAPNRQAELGYGYLLKVEVGSMGGDASLLVVSTTLSITCGDDSSLMLLRRGESGWRPILIDESSDYGDVSGAHGSLNWRASERNSGNGLLMVIADIPPWCSSVWRPLRYRAYRVGSGFEKPVQLVSRSTDAIVMDAGYEIRVDASGFFLSYSVEDKNHRGTRVRETLGFRIQGTDILPDGTRPGG